MSRDPKNKVIVVTGGAQGIGYEIAENFLKSEAKAVAVLDFNEEAGIAAVKTLNSKYGEKASFFKCDVTKDLEAVFNQIVNKYETVDVLVNNAGVLDEKSIKRTMETNATALIEWTMKFREHMRTDSGGKGGTIINMSSIYGFFVDQYLPFYKASKYAVLGFTKTIGHEECFKIFGVRVVALCPGLVHTNMGVRVEQEADMPGFEKCARSIVWLEAEEVGKAAVDVFKVADSGTVWKLESDKPITLVE